MHVRYVKDVPQSGVGTPFFIKKRNPLCALIHPTVHFFIPYLYGSADCGVRSLGIDKKLVFERVFVEP
ncbi:hypothetical protein [Enterocloster clostridioformis]|uniref:hypothetical protein n=1 Tax=Enterocloster clostridioformis TaxID=1531 RepID=UPI0022E9652B|nr:hypothetical protein [Enterocloster clostridioformis]